MTYKKDSTPSCLFKWISTNSTWGKPTGNSPILNLHAKAPTEADLQSKLKGMKHVAESQRMDWWWWNGDTKKRWIGLELVTLKDILGAWCLKHQPFIIPSPPRNLFEFLLFPQGGENITPTPLWSEPSVFFFKATWNPFWKCTSSDEKHFWKYPIMEAGHTGVELVPCKSYTWTDFNGAQHLWRQPVSWRSWR